MRLVVVSTHLDDGVFSCGALIATASQLMPVVVLTVCAGFPPENARATLDRMAGFATSRAAILGRRAEDESALAILGATPVHLDLLDRQYGVAVTAGQVRDAVFPLLEDGDVVAAPVGIRHDDHLTVAAALRDRADLLYEDIPYRTLWPEMAPALGEPTLEIHSCPVKRRAIACYASQIGGEMGVDLDATERYHRP